ncbi:topoisomerase [Streptomyces sp. NBC_00237]|uniref:toprim domain-containing protein n=1 Tax=Streptomyces sp. NBC_00237 TaxID=2975687 RepID=UPI0033903AD3
MPGSPAEEYVRARGLGPVAESFGLGFVASALPGHDRYRGYLSIPYLRPAGGEQGVATVRFRCIADRCVKGPDGQYLFLTGGKEVHEGHGKYLSLPGDPPRIHNTSALIADSSFVVVVEGEFDDMSWAMAGVPAVGIPGTGSWRDYWHPPFLGYEVVYLIAEGDQAGQDCMEALASEMPNGKVIRLPDVYDSNRLLIEHGPQALTERLGI